MIFPYFSPHKFQVYSSGYPMVSPAMAMRLCVHGVRVHLAQVRGCAAVKKGVPQRIVNQGWLTIYVYIGF